MNPINSESSSCSTERGQAQHIKQLQNEPTKGFKMKTTIAILITLLSITVTRAAELYNSKELALSAFGGWVDKEDSKFAPGAA